MSKVEEASHPGTPAVPAWRLPFEGEHRWPVGVAILTAVGLQLAVPTDLAMSPHWVLPALELALFAVLWVYNPWRINRESRYLRVVSLALVTVASLATALSAGRLVYALVYGHLGDAGPLLLNGGAIWLTNVIVFALWYWEFDRGGPAARAHARHQHPDFLFPQMTTPHLARPHWRPTFADYFYLSFTNSTAFSPTDTLPLSRWAKMAMMFQSAVSLVTVVLVIARAINVMR